MTNAPRDITRLPLLERLFYWLGRRLGKLPTLADSTGLTDGEDRPVATEAIVTARGHFYACTMIVTHADGLPLVHALSASLIAAKLKQRTKGLLTVARCRRGAPP